MILNGFAILVGFVALLQFSVALLIIGLALSILRCWQRASCDARTGIENQGYLLSSLSLLLLLLNLVSWPLLYLLLESYVPEWPGVMCIYGVTQVGAGSDGMSRHLPSLLSALQWLKPALVFGSGAWGMLYLANRRTATAPLMGRMLLVSLGLGLLALLDASLETAYLLISKKEEFLASGCCTVTADDMRFLPAAIVPDEQLPWLGWAYYLANGGMILGMFAYVPTRPRRPGVPGLGVLLIGAVLTLLISRVYLIDVGAPTLLRLPYHHCPFDLIGKAPEALLAVASFVLGTFAVGWACVASWFARCQETQAFLAEQVRKVLVVGLFGYAGSIVMLGAELALVDHLVRHDVGEACAFDGGKIDSRYGVRVVDKSGTAWMFCDIACAASWIQRDARGYRAAYVVDETSGLQIEAAAAFFVRSPVITNRTTGNRIHAFLTDADAEKHVRVFGGRLLKPGERPFAHVTTSP